MMIGPMLERRPIGRGANSIELREKETGQAYTVKSKFGGYITSLICMTGRLVSGRTIFDVSMKALSNLSLYQENPELLRKPYHVRGTSDLRSIRQFIRAV